MRYGRKQRMVKCTTEQKNGARDSSSSKSVCFRHISLYLFVISLLLNFSKQGHCGDLLPGKKTFCFNVKNSSKIKIKKLWKTRIKESYADDYGYLYIYKDHLYLSGKSLYCLDAKSGNLKWVKQKANAGQRISFWGKFVVAANNQKMFLLKRITGEVVWRKKFDDIITTMKIDNKKGILYLTTLTKIFSFDLEKRKVIWSKNFATFPGGGLTQFIFPPTFYDGNLLLGTNMQLYVISKKSGDLLLYYFDGQTFPISPIYFFLISAFDCNHICAASTFRIFPGFLSDVGLPEPKKEYRLIKFEKPWNEMRKKWERKIFPAASEPVIYGNYIYIVTFTNHNYNSLRPRPFVFYTKLTCYQKKNGEKIWDYHFEVPAAYSIEKRLSYCNGLLIYCHNSAGVFFFNLKDGRLLGRIFIKENPEAKKGDKCAVSRNLYRYQYLFHDGILYLF